MKKMTIREKVRYDAQQYDREHGWVRVEGDREIYFNGSLYVFSTGDAWRVSKTTCFCDAYARYFKTIMAAKVYADSKKKG